MSSLRNSKKLKVQLLEKMYSAPTLIHSTGKSDLPEEKKLFWLAAGCVILVSREQGWYVIDVPSGKIVAITWRSGEPKVINPEEALGDSGLVPDEETVVDINHYLSEEAVEHEDPEHVLISSIRSTTYDKVSTIFCEDSALDYALDNWAHHYGTHVMVSAWKVVLNGEDIGIFLSHKKPLVEFGREICGYCWFILVERWDTGIDIYRVTDRHEIK